MGPPTALRTAASLRRQCSPNCRTQLWSCSPGRSLPSARRAVLAAGSATGVGTGQEGAGRLTCGPAAGTRRTGCRNRHPRRRAPGGPRSRPPGRSRSAGRWARGTRRRSGGLTGSVPQGVVSSAWRRTGGQRRSGGAGRGGRRRTAVPPRPGRQLRPPDALRVVGLRAGSAGAGGVQDGVGCRTHQTAAAVVAPHQLPSLQRASLADEALLQRHHPEGGGAAPGRPPAAPLDASFAPPD